MRKLNEECGVFGIIGVPEASNLSFLGLFALQHRGQEGCGIVSVADEDEFYSHKSLGLVADAFSVNKLKALPGQAAIGHVRYSTSGGKRNYQNVQPFKFNTSIGTIALCHNGNLTNADLLKSELESQGSIFQSTSDTEIFMHLMARSGGGNVLDRLAIAMRLVKGAYSLLMMTKDTLFAARDPHGFRPLVLGEKDGGYVVCSETCALDLIGANFVRDVEPGEILTITREGFSSQKPLPHQNKSFCSFEPIYFARPDSLIGESNIYSLRKKMGSELAKESHVEADMVIAVPDSGVPMATGYAEATGLPFELGFVRNHYIGRTFIEPSQSIRDFGVKLKLNPVKGILKDKRVVVVDDSIVRGTTSRKIIRMLRESGAKEIHLRVGSPPITHSCYYGVDTPEREGLISAQKTTKELCDLLGCDTLAFLSRDGLKQALTSESKESGGYCYGCFTGNYNEDICRTINKQPTDDGGPGLKSF